MTPPRYTSRRGVTFIEVVLGVVLLSLVATTLAATVSGIGKSFQRQRDRLAAAEVASRILLQRVDDEEGMPDKSMPVGYGEREFRWRVDEHPTIVTLSAPAREAMEENARSGGVELSRRIIAVTITAWLAEDSGGAYNFDTDLPHAVLTRLIDPISFSTHDSAQRRLDTQQDIERFLSDFVNTTTGTLSRPSGNQNGNRPGTRPGTRPGARPGAGQPDRATPREPGPAAPAAGGGG